jgi:hypothetical protein
MTAIRELLAEVANAAGNGYDVDGDLRKAFKCWRTAAELHANMELDSFRGGVWWQNKLVFLASHGYLNQDPRKDASYSQLWLY